jgi:hypothetical protein
VATAEANDEDDDDDAEQDGSASLMKAGAVVRSRDLHSPRRFKGPCSWL